MTDPLNPYEEPVKTSPGETMQKHAENVVELVKFFGGPSFNADAIAKVMADLRTWWIR